MCSVLDHCCNIDCWQVHSAFTLRRDAGGQFETSQLVLTLPLNEIPPTGAISSVGLILVRKQSCALTLLLVCDAHGTHARTYVCAQANSQRFLDKFTVTV